MIHKPDYQLIDTNIKPQEKEQFELQFVIDQKLSQREILEICKKKKKIAPVVKNKAYDDEFVMLV